MASGYGLNGGMLTFVCFFPRSIFFFQPVPMTGCGRRAGFCSSPINVLEANGTIL